MNKRLRELTGNTIIFAIGTIGSKIVLFFLVPLYTNVLSTTEYGTADLVQTVSSLLVPILSIMIQDAVLRYGLSKEVDQNVLLKNALVITVIGMIIGLFSIPLFSCYKAVSSWTIYLYFITIINMLQNVLYSYTKTVNKNKLYAVCGILSAFILAISNFVLLIWVKMGVEGYLLAIIISHLFAVLFLGFSTKAFSGMMSVHADKELLKSMVKYSMPLIVNNISWWVVNASDRIMIERYTDVSYLGLYTAASKIPALISLINTVFLQAWIISVIREYEERQDTGFSSKVFRYYSLLMFGATSFFILILKIFMSVYVGNQYQESWIFVPLLLLGTTFYGFSLFFGAIYSAAKANVNIALSTIAAALVNVGINFLFMRKYGAMIGAVSTAASYCAVGLFRMIDSRRLFSFKVDYIRFAVNSFLVFFQVILVSLNYNIYEVSLVTIVLLIMFNLKDVITIPRFIISSLKKGK